MPRYTRLPIGLYAEISGDGPSVFGRIHGYADDSYVIRIGGTDTLRTFAATNVALHPSYERIDSPLLDTQILTQILARRMPVGLNVEVNDGGASYYGQITGYSECNYQVRVGGTERVTLVAPEAASAHPVFRALRLEQQRRIFEHLPRLPKTGTIGPEAQLSRLVSSKLESLINGGAINLGASPQNPRDPSLLGVGLFRIAPKTGTLTVWNREGNADIHYGAMTGSYPTKDFDDSLLIDAKALCESLLQRSKILEYFSQIYSDLSTHNIVAHLHYYRNRDVPDPGFHKDTRGQTLFFMLQYLNEKPIFGPEWVEDVGMELLAEKSFVLVTSGGRQYLKSATSNRFFQSDGHTGWTAVVLENWEVIRRTSPSEIEGIWPKSIRDALTFEKKRQTDSKIHVARIEPFGAVLVVDDLVHHRSPNANSREDWGNIHKNHSQNETVQAFDAHHENRLYRMDMTGRTRARSMSNAREQLEKWRLWQLAQREQESSETAIVEDEREQPILEEDLSERWNNTFSGQRRRFFRLWVTVSPKPVVKEADKVWF